MIYIYILVMAGVTYLIRMLPLTLIQKKISNVDVRSFLYYVPYTCLTAMTFPAIYMQRNLRFGACRLCHGCTAGLKEKKSGNCGFVFLRGSVRGRKNYGIAMIFLGSQFFSGYT